MATTPKTPQTGTKTASATSTTTPRRSPEVMHAIQHVEIVSKDPAKLQAFLEKTFGWTFDVQAMPGGGNEPYRSFRTPDGNGGGVTGPMMPDQAIACTPYINVADCAASEKACKKNGATIVMPTTDIPGVGKFFMFQYPSAPILACFQSTNPNRN